MDLVFKIFNDICIKPDFDAHLVRIVYTGCVQFI